MGRFLFAAILTIFMGGIGGCKGESSPQERAAQLKAFLKKGMDWTEVAKAFPPKLYSVAMTDPKDPSKRIGGMICYSEEEFREVMARGHDGFTLDYRWTEVRFDRNGKFYEAEDFGDFEHPK